jgi:hypothetical protein
VVAKLSTWPMAWSEPLLGATVTAALAIAQALAALAVGVCLDPEAGDVGAFEVRQENDALGHPGFVHLGAGVVRVLLGDERDDGRVPS